MECNAKKTAEKKIAQQQDEEEEECPPLPGEAGYISSEGGGRFPLPPVFLRKTYRNRRKRKAT